jgi:hypothetical protein
MSLPASSPLRGVFLLAFIAVASLWWTKTKIPHAIAAEAASVASGSAQPVLVELFTSEGCSSCPPADALLARLDTTQFVPGAQAIVLSEHVTYWNQLGWRDPFSMESMTERQQQYASHFGLESAYTPQAVVDGAAELVGSDADAMSRAVAQAAQASKQALTIGAVSRQEDTVRFAVKSKEPEHAKLVVAVAEDATVSTVQRGENAGRTLHHVAVVRVLKAMGADQADGRALALKLNSPEIFPEQGKTLRLVAFLADSRTGKVLAVAEQPVGR